MNLSFLSIELILRKLRIKKILPYFAYGGVLVDVGCDDPPLLIDMVKKKMDFCIGIDAEAKPKLSENVEIKKCWIKKTLPVESELATMATMLAVLEHMDHPRAIVAELYRVLRFGGTALITVPSLFNKPLLELLAFLHVVRPEMIAQHKNYFTKKELEEMFYETGFKKVIVNYFQFGLNTIVRAIK